ncbi:hypothetical protein PHO31112_02255 [Pandoraea horticolens]|uniref:Uncharacterized protein n=1 Tax=Pandoraea horticolens TaxID=2508298 RepID=A0A5E4UY26_9BURK|nr:hypothetical protein PHO31112_02255 [Pandoraea horticolens]
MFAGKQLNAEFIRKQQKWNRGDKTNAFPTQKLRPMRDVKGRDVPVLC